MNHYYNYIRTLATASIVVYIHCIHRVTQVSVQVAIEYILTFLSSPLTMYAATTLRSRKTNQPKTQHWLPDRRWCSLCTCSSGMTGVSCSPLLYAQHKSGEHLARNVGVCKHSNLRFHHRQLIMYVIKVGLIKKDLPSLNLCACVMLMCVMVWNGLDEWDWPHVSKHEQHKTAKGEQIVVVAEIAFLFDIDRWQVA